MTDFSADGRFSVWAQREGVRTYRGHNSRGASVLMGEPSVPGAFTPGELLQIALAGCAGMTTDGVVQRRLTGDTSVVLGVEASTHETEDRYTGFTETLMVDLSGLDDAARAQLAATVRHAVGVGCTVGLTLLAGADVTVDIAQR
ncbi:MAG: OsmC family protein [Propionibacteriaceae bacterium]|nr:OsmC family protein [Propionibacteriaceae bacterium]